MHWVVFVVIVVHAIIHLMGAAKAFGVAELANLTQPISRPMGVLWLAAAALLIASALTLVLAPRWFWVVGAIALVLSQIVLVSSWRDAKFGTIANAILLLAIVYGFLSEGPTSLRAEYRKEVGAALARAPQPRLVIEDDLTRLPEPVRAYVRASGAVGKPQVVDFRAVWKGRIRSAESEPWMTFRAEQVSGYDAAATRLFLMDATMKHLPLDVFHRFVADAATFRVRLLSALTMVDAKGPWMNRAETVTIFNDLCLLAPGQLIDPTIVWEPIDDRHVRARYTRGSETISAELVFNADNELVDFVSDDRTAASSDGRTFTPQRWRTPVHGYGSFGARHVMKVAEARWEPKDGGFTYLEIELESIDYNIGVDAAVSTPSIDPGSHV